MQSVFEAWREQIEAHERDMQALRGEGHEHGHGHGLGHGHGDGHGRPGGFGFTNRPLDPHRTDDAALNGIFAVLGPGTEVLDVGGGSGRYALPLATRTRRVTVVEQSEDSVELLTSRAEEAGIDNITVINEAWEDAEAPTADMALCSLVLHHVPDVVPFVSKLQDHATDRVVILEMAETPGAVLHPFFERVHGSTPSPLPGLARLMEVLWAMDIYPDLEMLAPKPAIVAPDRETTLELMQRRLGVEEGSAEDERLRAAADELLEETPNGIRVRGAAPHRQGIITWRPTREDFRGAVTDERVVG